MDELLRKLNSLSQLELRRGHGYIASDEIRETPNGDYASLDEIAKVFGVKRHWDGTFIIDENAQQLAWEDSLR